MHARGGPVKERPDGAGRDGAGRDGSGRDGRGALLTWNVSGDVPIGQEGERMDSAVAEWVRLFMDPAVREGSPASVGEEQEVATAREEEKEEEGKVTSGNGVGFKGKRSAVAEGAEHEAPAVKRKRDAKDSRRPRTKDVAGCTTEAAARGHTSKEAAPPPRERRKSLRRP